MKINSTDLLQSLNELSMLWILSSPLSPLSLNFEKLQNSFSLWKFAEMAFRENKLNSYFRTSEETLFSREEKDLEDYKILLQTLYNVYFHLFTTFPRKITILSKRHTGQRGPSYA